VRTDGHVLTKSFLDSLGVSRDDRLKIDANIYHYPLTRAMKEQLENNPHVLNIEVESSKYGGSV
jgi:hypothetical protein